MHLMQKELLEDFKQKYQGHTLKQFAKLTGIERTRIFRLFNGQEIKISEWERIRKLTYGEKIEAINLEEHLGRKREEFIESVKRVVGLRNLKYQLV